MTSITSTNRPAVFWLMTALLFSLAFVCPTSSQAVSFPEKLADQALLAQLRQGGLVIYMRHGNTDNTRPDQAPRVNLTDCNTQRPLSDTGRELSKQVGHYVREAKIPYQNPITSPMCRAKETAQLAFIHINTDEGLTYSGSMTSEEKTPVLARTRQLLSDPVLFGTNRLLVAHAPNLMDIMGYFPKEGTLVIFQPQGNNQFTYLGSIPPEHWDNLLHSH